MHKLVNHLIQLQELTWIRDEQKVSALGGHLESLDASIKTMTAQLPEKLRSTFNTLHRKDRMVIVPITDNNCAGCGMMVPISLVQSVRQAKNLLSCPNCARMLYYVESPLKRIEQRTPRSAPRPVGVRRFSAPSLMIPGLQVDDMDGCIEAMSSVMAEAGFVEDAGKLAEGVLRREAVLSTVVDHGLAFPHVRCVEGGGLTFAMGTNRKGLKLDPDGEKLTKIVFLMVIPTAAGAFYLKLLAGLTETFRMKDACKAILADDDPGKMWKTLTRITRTTIK